ncbi:MAG: peptidoglycan DD-metalloendopeptidase family protein [bacterium]
MQLKNLVVFLSNKWLKKTFFLIGNLILHQLLTRLYGSYLMIKKIFFKLYLPAKNKLFFPLTHRYTIHFILIIIAVLIATINISAHELGNENFGQNTLLSSLVNPVQDEYIEEKAIQEGSLQPVVTSYLGATQEVAQVNNLPLSDIETEDLEQEVPSLTQGGTALIRPEIGPSSDQPRTRTSVETYVVQNGDTISGIAAQFGITINTVLWANNLTSYSYIRPGEKINILPVSGLLYTVKKGDTLAGIIKIYGGEEKDIRSYNNMEDGGNLVVGQKVIIPGGQMPRPKATPRTYTVPPSSKVVTGGGMLWPIGSRRITQYFSWRHSGVDIGIPIGTPIYASEAGVVIGVGWSGGYGNQIVVDHGNGKTTRYAHLSQVYVKKGQAVEKGQTIALSGNTGWSTGPHLHFEVMIYGIKYNPLNYVR